MMGNMDQRNNSNMSKNSEENNSDMEDDRDSSVRSEVNNPIRNDENIQMLKAIRSIVTGDKAIFIDKVIDSYNNGVFDD